jgi:hypothetical protein
VSKTGSEGVSSPDRISNLDAKAAMLNRLSF